MAKSDYYLCMGDIVVAVIILSTTTVLADFEDHYAQALKDIINDANLPTDPYTLLDSVRHTLEDTEKLAIRDLISEINGDDKNEKYYTYLVLLGDRGDCETFAQFVRRIIYVGKGTGGRVIDHLAAAYEYKQGTGNDVLSSRISKRWNEGKSEPVSLIIMIDVITEKEAFAREAAMLFVFGEGNICPIGGRRTMDDAQLDRCQLANKAHERSHQVKFSRDPVEQKKKLAEFGIYQLFRAYSKIVKGEEFVAKIYEQ